MFLGVVPHNRLCRGVLVLPANGADYLRGRARHALRNNLRRAERAGISCQHFNDPAEAVAVMQAIYLDRQWIDASALASMTARWSAIFNRPEVTLLVARDPSGQALAIAATVVDEEVCLFRAGFAVSHEASWALHQYLVRELTDRDVRYLVGHDGGPFGALALAPSLQYYQRLLGYQICHVRPVGRRLRDPSRERHPLR
jgi:hypothetical protein